MTDGIFAIRKPRGLTSHDVVDEVRRITGERRVGHAGTLDPLASGVLVIGVGRAATRQLGTIVCKEKEYVARVRLGAESTTDDAEGERRTVPMAQRPSLAEVRRTLRTFMGTFAQVPPTFSALKVRGTPAHRRARRGEQVVLRSRLVTVKCILLVRYRWPYLTLHLVTGPGFYVRALARDLGRRLGVGGYLASLERVRVGDFTKDRALTLAAFQRAMRKAAPRRAALETRP